MMNGLSLIYGLALIVCFIGCNRFSDNNLRGSTEDKVIRQYHADGSLKISVKYVKEKRHGLAKSYYKNGQLKKKINYQGDVKHGQEITYFPNGQKYEEIHFKNGKRHGLTKIYYKSGLIRQKSNYLNDLKHGLTTNFYKNGAKFETVIYEKGKIQGLRSKYRMDGRLMAEIPYYNNRPCAGLVEYLVTEERKTSYPSIVIIPIDNRLEKGQYTLLLSLSDKSKDVEFYSAELLDSGCLPLSATSLEVTSGKAEVTFDIPPGNFIMKELNFIAKVNTKLGNPYFVETNYYLAIENI